VAATEARRAGDAALLEDMRRALLAEFGAQAIYRHLAPRVRRPELRSLLERLHAEEDAQIARVRAVMEALGERPATRSRRRRVLAWCLAAISPLTGRSLVLRICTEAETTAARWYAQFHEYLAAVGELELARACAELSSYKLRRAHALQPWLDLSRGDEL
jgi:demethoxyubiquinone hydroxylase (CLK1/Coq7/Cat5 family)